MAKIKETVMHSVPDHPETVPIPGDILLSADQLTSSPVTANEIRIMTKKYPLLAKVFTFCATWLAAY